FIMPSLEVCIFLLAVLIAFVSTQACVDLATDCYCKLGLCTNPAYTKLMTKMCNRSCGFCTPNPGK
ncbi:hypothetical protein PFISCL1PPCAC_26951, partial [Pristionchus fissidentatus]